MGSGLVDLYRRCGKRYFFFMLFLNGIFVLKEILFAVCPVIEKIIGRDFFSIRNYVKRQAIPFDVTGDFNSPEFVQTLKEWNPDIIVTRVNQILKREILSLPRHGCWCCHSSLLPDYKGIAAEFYNLLEGEPLAGFTVFRMTERLDEGEIVSQGKTEVLATDSLHSLMRRNSRKGSYVLWAAIIDKLNGNSKLRKQPPGGTYYSWPGPSSVAQFKINGKTFIRISEAIRYILGREATAALDE